RQDRLGNDHPPERPAPAAKQPVIKRDPALVTLGAPLTPRPVPRKEPVANPGNFPPARKPPNQPGKLITGKRRPPSPRRQREQHHPRLEIRTPNKRVPRNDNPHRPASSPPHPPKRNRP